ncbi:uncharacterized protein METZ01_LOCUS497393, partial [marine metagenome]
MIKKAILPALVYFTVATFVHGASLEPQLVQIDNLVLEENFSKSRPVNKDNWK